MRRTDERGSESPSAERGPVLPVSARSASLWPALTASLALHALVLVGLLALPGRIAGPARNVRSLEVFLLPPPVVEQQVELTEALPEPPKVESLPAAPSRPVPSTPRPSTEVAPRTVARQLPAPPTRSAPVALPRPPARLPDPEPPPAVVKTGTFAAVGRAESEPSRPDRTVERRSGFDTPSADAAAADRDARVVAGGLFGDGMATPAFASSSGGADEAAITIRFDATTVAPVATKTDSSVQRGGFDDDAPRRKPTRREPPAERFDTPVEIVSKQNPVYTDRKSVV